VSGRRAQSRGTGEGVLVQFGDFKRGLAGLLLQIIFSAQRNAAAGRAAERDVAGEISNFRRVIAQQHIQAHVRGQGRFRIGLPAPVMRKLDRWISPVSVESPFAS